MQHARQPWHRLLLLAWPMCVGSLHARYTFYITVCHTAPKLCLMSYLYTCMLAQSESSCLLSQVCCATMLGRQHVPSVVRILSCCWRGSWLMHEGPVHPINSGRIQGIHFRCIQRATWQVAPTWLGLCVSPSRISYSYGTLGSFGSSGRTYGHTLRTVCRFCHAHACMPCSTGCTRVGCYSQAVRGCAVTLGYRGVPDVASLPRGFQAICAQLAPLADVLFMVLCR
jgi:hypothetical protein